MIEQLKAFLQQIGQGLTAQHMGDMSATVEHISQRSQNFHLAGGQGRVVLIVSTDPLGPAFEFVTDLAEQTQCIIEILYITPPGENKRTLNTMLNKLSNLTYDFQITHITGDICEKIAVYSTQREDIVSVVCSSVEPFTEELKSAPKTLKSALRFTFPTILLIGNKLLA